MVEVERYRNWRLRPDLSQQISDHGLCSKRTHRSNVCCFLSQRQQIEQDTHSALQVINRMRWCETLGQPAIPPSSHTHAGEGNVKERGGGGELWEGMTGTPKRRDDGAARHSTQSRISTGSAQSHRPTRHHGAAAAHTRQNEAAHGHTSSRSSSVLRRAAHVCVVLCQSGVDGSSGIRGETRQDTKA